MLMHLLDTIKLRTWIWIFDQFFHQSSSSTQSLPSIKITSSQKPSQSTTSSSTLPITSSTIKGITGTQAPVTTDRPVGEAQSNSKVT